MGENLGAFLAHPAFQQLSAYLEVPGENKQGPNANEIQKLRDLHARWLRTRSKQAVTSSVVVTPAARWRMDGR